MNLKNRVIVSHVLLVTIVFTLSMLSNLGDARTECKVEDCKITITIKIAFAGATDQQIRDWTNDIESVWNGPNGFQTTGDCQCEVRFKVETMKITDPSQANCNPPPAGYHCVMVTAWNGRTESLPFFYNSSGQKEYVVGYMGYSTQSPSQGGASLDGWWSDQMNQPAPGGGTYHDAAHEAGHMMGLNDRDGNGLMTHTSGDNAKPTQQNIDDAVNNVCGPNACPDRCCCGNGVVEPNKGESCDPFAQPMGCGQGEFCCPTCCSCYAPTCLPANGEYSTQGDCVAACTDGNCYQNYKTGCWDCVKPTIVIEQGVYDPEQAREQGSLFHKAHGEGFVMTQAELDLVRDIYNQNINSVPMVRDMLANERINFYVEGAGVVAIVNEGGQMQSIEAGEMPDQTMNMYVDMETLEDIMVGETDPVEALKEGKITYEGVGFFNWLRFAFANAAFGIGAALGLV
jgi:putative sterol carrier protein